MKKVQKRILIMVLFTILFARPLTIFASGSGSDFVEIPNVQINIKSSSNGSINPLAEPSLGACDLGIGICKNGLGIEYTTRTTVTATEIGVKDLVLQEKTTFGWKDIPVKNHSTTDSDYYTGSIVYLKAEPDKSYRVYCTHYAIIDGIEYTLYNETNPIVYN